MKLEPFAPVCLRNGLLVRFVEEGNRYFGDYHRIRITAVVSFPEDYPLPEGLASERVRLEKPLEKMGVPTAELEQERRRLVDSFLATTRTYLERDDFPQQLLEKIRREKPKPAFLRES